MKTRRALVPLAVLAAAATLAGCGGSGSSQPQVPTIQPARTFRLAGLRPAAPVAPGTPMTLGFTINQPNGQPLTRFHRGAGPHNGVHVIVVSDDLSTIIHRHPPVGAGGRISERIVLPKPGTYRVVVDAYPAAGPQRNFQLFGTVRASGTPRAAPLPPFRATDIVDGYRVTLHGKTQLHAIQAAFLTVDGRRLPRPAGSIHSLVRRPRARDLLPPRLARLLPHARLRARSERLHQPARRSERYGHVLDPGQAASRRARPGRRDLAPVPPVQGRRPRPHRPVHPDGEALTRRAANAAGWCALGALVVLARALDRLRACTADARSPLELGRSLGGPLAGRDCGRRVRGRPGGLGDCGRDRRARRCASGGARAEAGPRAAPADPAGPSAAPRRRAVGGELAVLSRSSSRTSTGAQGLGWHGIHCLLGPVHRNAIPILAALSLARRGARLCARARRSPGRGGRSRRLLAATTATTRARRAAAASRPRSGPRRARLCLLSAPAGPASTPGDAAVVIVTEGETMKPIRGRHRALAVLVASVAALAVGAAVASAHARISPPVVALEDVAALQPRRPDREGGPDDDEDRADRPERIRNRLVRARPRLDAAGAADRLRARKPSSRR